MGEFELIDRFFKRPVKRSPLGIGDDCALLAPAAGMQLALSSDMLVEGRHFLSTVDPFKLGHKALAVNLSDLAACGARPLAFTLALSMPQAEEAWLEPFSRGLFTLADEHACELVGGDTTRGPLNICITVFGEVPSGQALLRSGAAEGDDIYASGTLGEARLALEAFRGTVSLPAGVFEAARAHGTADAARGAGPGLARHRQRRRRRERRPAGRPGPHPAAQRCRRAHRHRCGRRPDDAVLRSRAGRGAMSRIRPGGR
jgi:thiamine-monophosphate kinase